MEQKIMCLYIWYAVASIFYVCHVWWQEEYTIKRSVYMFSPK